jgi:hypothetical protein
LRLKYKLYGCANSIYVSNVNTIEIKHIALVNGGISIINYSSMFFIIIIIILLNFGILNKIKYSIFIKYIYIYIIFLYIWMYKYFKLF